jgi:hypothetical protein
MEVSPTANFVKSDNHEISSTQNPPRHAGTAYEQMWLDNIKQNKKLLKQLGLEKGGAAVIGMTPKVTSKKGKDSSKRPRL